MVLPTPSRAHWNYGSNPYWHQPYPQPHAPFQAPPPPPAPAPAPVYVDARGGRGFRGRGGHPRRLVWFTIGSLTTLWWINKTSSCESRGPGSFGFCASRSLALPPPPSPSPSEIVETKDETSSRGGGRGFGGWRRKREEEEMKRREEKRLMEEKWKVDSEKLVRAAEEAKEKMRDFASQRLDDMLAALTELKKDLKPSTPQPAKTADVRLV